MFACIDYVLQLLSWSIEAVTEDHRPGWVADKQQTFLTVLETVKSKI